MKHLLCMLFMLMAIHLQAQVGIKKSSVSTAGGSSNVGNIKLLYSIGEVAVNENTNGQAAISEGFVGPDLLASLGIENYHQITGLEVYPNPVKSKLNFSFPRDYNYQIYLYDINGKLISYTENDSNLTYRYNISHFKTGVYMLVIIDRKNQEYKSIKIQKL